MLGMNEIRKGKVIVFEDEPWVVMSADFLRKQQRRPVMRTILKHLKTEKVREHTFQQSDKVEEAALERKAMQFLYGDENSFSFMDPSSFEQLDLSAEAVGELARYLLPEQEVEVMFFEGRPLAVSLPIKIERKVIEAPPGVRGDTSTNVMKDAVIEGGVKIKVPLFIDEGDVIRVDTRTGEYVERV